MIKSTAGLFTGMSIVLALPVATPAQAKATGPASVAVGYADLDLSRKEDVAVLRKRLMAAIEDVCGSYTDDNRDQHVAITQCRMGTRARMEATLAALVAPARSVEFAKR